ncbi:hypothetical protein ACFQFC_34320 [Amorphoplanes digitatis]|uniref:ABC-type transporter Mla subunit MlaD n=1 Tax=Actinoplanes digitatis TaxID=1868 RepID=A0A7W7MP81_9ACTN|nr:hypothetical protein [Actinoplanes digitatis]MBB4761240.1 ABC-type transporter Mla subunit MlaD [Actinoplanes digitatis]BFE69625.1 hypothetical protein GCM10020092_029260 [Actinoplanes digitatis]GID92856.1 hypothetical protein Adi01nite_22680 [Actinoplanes digitatis]
MSASELRDQTLKRQRELAARHAVLSRLTPEQERHADQLVRVFDATNDLIAVLDRVDARSARRRMLAAIALLGLVVAVAAVVAAGYLPEYALIGALALLVAAVVVWIGARGRAPSGRPEGAA